MRVLVSQTARTDVRGIAQTEAIQIQGRTLESSAFGWVPIE